MKDAGYSNGFYPVGVPAGIWEGSVYQEVGGTGKFGERSRLPVGIRFSRNPQVWTCGSGAYLRYAQRLIGIETK